MTVPDLVRRYEAGALADHEFVARCVLAVDPDDPGASLELLPPHTLPRLEQFVSTYRAGEMLASDGGPIPSPEQVAAAKRWMAKPE